MPPLTALLTVFIHKVSVLQCLIHVIYVMCVMWSTPVHSVWVIKPITRFTFALHHSKTLQDPYIIVHISCPLENIITSSDFIMNFLLLWSHFLDRQTCFCSYYIKNKSNYDFSFFPSRLDSILDELSVLTVYYFDLSLPNIYKCP